MVAPLTPTERALLATDPQLIRRIRARQYRMALERPGPGEPADRTFVTVTGHPVGWHRRRRIAELFKRGLAYADDDLVVTLTRRSLLDRSPR